MTTPPTEPATLPPPPATASREEWRAWRHAMRRNSRAWATGGIGRWTWFWGVALILVGAYYLLKNLGLLEWVRSDVIWPVLLIALGLWLIVSRALR